MNENFLFYFVELFFLKARQAAPDKGLSASNL